MQVLCFLCMARRLSVLYKCIQFRLNIPNGYQVIEQTRFCDEQTEEQTDRQGINNLSSNPSKWET